MRCDQAAAALYAEKSWRAIDDHVYDKLAKELYSLQQYQQSIHFFVQLIGRPRNIDMTTARPINPLVPRPSREAQERFLHDLVFVVQKWYGVVGEGKEVPGLRLPSFVDESVQVVTNDDNTVPACYATQAWNQATRTQKMTVHADQKSAHTPAHTQLTHHHRSTSHPTPLVHLLRCVCSNKPLFNPSMTLYKESDRGCVVNGQQHSRTVHHR